MEDQPAISRHIQSRTGIDAFQAWLDNMGPQDRIIAVNVVMAGKDPVFFVTWERDETDYEE